MRDSIRLEGVHFSYGSDQSEVLKGIDVEIRRGERIGLIGSTGSGKSTTIDLLMGLLSPTAGFLRVDDENLHDPLHPELLSRWRASVLMCRRAFTCQIARLLKTCFWVPRHEIGASNQTAAQSQTPVY